MNLINSDCLSAMAALTQSSIDTIITDPPYGIGFMGKAWDSFETKFVADKTARYTEHRDETVKGGKRDRFASASSAGGTYDRSIAANRQFQDWCCEWATEALRVAKPGAFMLISGGTRTFHRMTAGIEDAGWEIRDCMMWLYGSGFPKSHNLHGEFEGWGTALKPAWEPIIVAMKPLDGTFVANAQRYGVAGLNIEGSRIGTGEDRVSGGLNSKSFDEKTGGLNFRVEQSTRPTGGRWPANLILDEACAELLDEQTGIGASRFFYCAKASKSERGAENVHPTVKPLKLMEYLCTLTKTPTGGIVLDPFMGSGTTGVAARNTGRDFIGIEKEEAYFKIAEARINGKI